jgi:hypothetical protein
MVDLPPRSLDDEIAHRVDTVRRELQAEFDAKLSAQSKAYEAAADKYRKRLLWFTSGIGALVLGLGVTWANDQISSRVSAQVSQSVAGIETRLRELVDLRFREQRIASDERIRSRIETVTGRQQAVMEGRLAEERTITTLLPLVVGEAIDFDDEAGDPYSSELIFNALEEIGPEVANLDGFTFDLAVRRLERILDTFWLRGQLHQVHRAFNVLPEELRALLLAHESEGVLYTMANALSEEILRSGHIPDNRRPTLDLVIAQTPDPQVQEWAYDQVAILRVVMVAAESGWDSDEIGGAFAQEAERWSAFPDYALRTQFCMHVRMSQDFGESLPAPMVTRLDAVANAVGAVSMQDYCQKG